MKTAKVKSGFSFLKGGKTKMYGKGHAAAATPGCTAPKRGGNMDY